MFLKLILSLFILLISSKGYCADWTADPDGIFAITFDEVSGNFLDSIGTFNGDMSGTSPAPPLRTEGKFFGGANFSGVNNYLPFGDVPIFDGLSNFTFNFWLAQSQDYTNSESDIIRKDGAFNIQDGAVQERVYIWTSDQPLGFDFIVASDNYPSDYWISEDGDWHMYTVTYNGTNIKAFRDCTQINSAALTGTVKNSSNIFSFGRKDPDEGGIVYAYTGKMDDILLVGREINSGECLDLMANGLDGRSGHYDTMFKGYNIKLNKVAVGGS